MGKALQYNVFLTAPQSQNTDDEGIIIILNIVGKALLYNVFLTAPQSQNTDDEGIY